VLRADSELAFTTLQILWNLDGLIIFKGLGIVRIRGSLPRVKVR
jgi:hypothetical protein